jgi:hypothetical protein
MGKGKKKPQGSNGSGNAPVPKQVANGATAPSAAPPSATSSAPTSSPLTIMSLNEPSTMSKPEYEELLEQIRSSFSKQECAVELLEAARYNDIDIVRAVLSMYPSILNHNGDNDNDGAQQPDGEAAAEAAKTKETTPLHYAAANGHMDVVQLLTQCGADPMAVNAQQNTPLHWAAANGHDKTVRILLHPLISTSSSTTTSSLTAIDVLQRNAAGRSILTEGFSSQNHDVVQQLLEHESASEEKLVATGSGKKPAGDDDNEEGNGDENKDGEDTAASIVHDLVFGRNPNPVASAGVRIRIREQVMARNEQDSILGQDSPDQDATGLGIWAAALVTAAWMVEEAVSSSDSSDGGDNNKTTNMLDRFANRTVIELGAGCGIPGMVVAASGSKNNDPSEDPNAAATARAIVRQPPSKVYLTDFNSKTVENLRHNAQLNQDQTTTVDVRYMNWQDPTTWPDERLDFVIGSDLIYQSDMVPLLVQTVAGLLQKNESSRFL